MRDLEAKLRTELDAASRQVGGDGIDRAGVDARVRLRAEHRRRRRRTIGALGAGLFVVLVVGAAVGLAQTRTSKSVDQPENFSQFCTVARKIQNGGNDVTGLSQQDADAKSRQNLLSLQAVAPESLADLFHSLLTIPPPTTSAESALRQSRMAAELADVLRQRCGLTAVLGETLRASPGAPDDSKHTSSGSCLEGPRWSVCLEGEAGSLTFKGIGLQPGTAVTITSLLLDGSRDPIPLTGIVDANGAFTPEGPALGRVSDAVRFSYRVTFTPAGGTERTEVLNN